MSSVDLSGTASWEEADEFNLINSMDVLQPSLSEAAHWFWDTQ